MLFANRDECGGDGARGDVQSVGRRSRSTCHDRCEQCADLRCSCVLVPTSCRSVNGGPSDMSSALVPGLILLEAPLSTVPVGNLLLSSNSDTPGDMGPVWSSAIGGGEGSRGDEEGDTELVVAMIDRCR